MTDGAPLSVVLIAGGVGGAKMAEGLAQLPGVQLTVIGNVADDDEFHGLWVSPDIDTMLYTLSGRINRAQGWGAADDGLRALGVLRELGQDDWMTLGDRDLGLHIYRTMRLRRGDARQAITDEIARAFAVPARILLPTEDIVQTRVRVAAGWLSFQEYFVRERCAPEALELAYHGLEDAAPNPAALAAIGAADALIIAPSNPLLSIAPILGVPGLRDAVRAASAPKIAISPLVSGKALKGPADRMMASLGFAPKAETIARLYADLIDMLVIDRADEGEAAAIRALSVTPVAEEIVMRSREDKARLARRVLALAAVQEEPA